MSHELSRENSSNENSPDGGQILLVILIGLALIASVIMLVADSDGALKIALLAALWAAIIGFFLVYRSRKQIDASRQELEALDAIHQAELEKAEAEQHAEQFRLEKKYQEKLREKDNETLRQIREQLEDMRAQLAELSGREWVYEPTALHAEARRILELESEQIRQERENEESEAVSDPEPVHAPEKPETPRDPIDVLDVVDVVIEEVTPAESEQPEQSVGPSVDPKPVWAPASEPEPQVETQPEPVNEQEGEPTADSARASRHAAVDAGGGRRRSDERRGGVSVAQLLAAAREQENQ